MEEPYSNDIPSFQRFLDKFVRKLSEETEESDDLPFRLSNLHFTSDELHGECLELCLRYLNLHHCPELLLAAISRSVYEEIQNVDESEFEDDEMDKKDEKQEEKKEEKDVNGDKIIDNKQEKVLSSAILCTHVIDVVNDICKKWQTNLPHIPVPKKIFQSSFSEIKNTRRKMEDRHVILPDLNLLFDLKDHPDQSYYAVFDGHAGVEASVYSATHLHHHLVNSPDFLSDQGAALKYAYKATDDRFVIKAQRENIKSGSTGVSVLIRGDKLHIAWLGDSQVVLVRDGKALYVMEPHKPERDDERARIEALGGIILHMGTWRVNGNLAVSRAIGDASQKQFICSDADINTIDLDGTEDYIVLACDGLWDTVTQESICDIVYNHLQETNGDKSSVARKLVTIAKDNGSSDNITVIVVFLRDEIAKPQIPQLFDFTQGDSQGNNNEEKEDNVGGDNSEQTNHSQSNSNMQNSSDNSNKKKDFQNNDKPSDNSLRLENAQNLAFPGQNRLSVNVSDNHSGDITEISEHSSEYPEITAVRKENQNKSNVNDEELSPDADLPVLKKENVFIFEGYHSNREPPNIDDIPQSRGERSSSLPSCLQMSADFQTAIHAGLVSESHPGTRNADSYLSLQGQSLSPENVGNLENRKFLASSVKKNGKNKLLMDRFRDLDYLTAEGLPDKELLAPISYAKHKPGKRKIKKSKKVGKLHSQKDPETSLRKSNKKPLENIPVVWAFAGSNKASVKNHKLNYAAKSGRVALATVGCNEVLDHSPLQRNDYSDKVDKTPKTKHIAHYDQREIENLVVPHPVFDSSNVTLNNSLPFVTSSTSSLPPVIHPTFAIYGSKSLANPQPEKFHMTWRPRRVHRVSNSVLSDVPPTPFSNIKISRNSEEADLKSYREN